MHFASRFCALFIESTGTVRHLVGKQSGKMDDNWNWKASHTECEMKRIDCCLWQRPQSPLESGTCLHCGFCTCRLALVEHERNFSLSPSRILTQTNELAYTPGSLFEDIRSASAEQLFFSQFIFYRFTSKRVCATKAIRFSIWCMCDDLSFSLWCMDSPRWTSGICVVFTLGRKAFHEHDGIILFDRLASIVAMRFRLLLSTIGKTGNAIHKRWHR